MKELIGYLTNNSAELKDIALLFLRLGVGAIFIKHGSLKIIRGKDELIWTGQQMKNLGITFWPLFWGICAMLAEFMGGIMLFLGLGVRIAGAFMAFTMFVAVIHHIAKKDPWGYISHPLAMMVVFSSLVISGAGKYSLDHLLAELSQQTSKNA